MLEKSPWPALSGYAEWQRQCKQAGGPRARDQAHGEGAGKNGQAWEGREARAGAGVKLSFAK